MSDDSQEEQVKEIDSQEDEEDVEEMDVEPNLNVLDEYVQRTVLICLNHVHKIKIEYNQEIELLNEEINQLRMIVNKIKV